MEKINIANLLKDCPMGMELNCVLFENVTFEGIKHDEYPIIVKIKEPPMALSLTKYGGWNLYNSAKCVIFPKNKTTWEGFVPPCKFKEGDVVVAEDAESFQLFLLKHLTLIEDDNSYDGYCYFGWDFQHNELFEKGNWGFNRLATEEEKAKLFDAIEASGYRWNYETKTLEKLPKFKVGDTVQNKTVDMTGTINLIINDEREYRVSLKNGGITYILFEFQDSWELVPSKFDINTLKPFDKVLVRSDNSDVWECDFFSLYNPKCSNRFHCIGAWYNICIPYIGNEHLRGTTNDCDEYFKNWEE